MTTVTMEVNGAQVPPEGVPVIPNPHPYFAIQSRANPGHFDIYVLGDDPLNDRPIGVVLRTTGGFVGFAKNQDDMPLGPAPSVEQAAGYVHRVSKLVDPADQPRRGRRPQPEEPAALARLQAAAQRVGLDALGPSNEGRYAVVGANRRILRRDRDPRALEQWVDGYGAGYEACDAAWDRVAKSADKDAEAAELLAEIQTPRYRGEEGA